MAKPTVNTKNLIQNFEAGDVSQTGPLSPTEKVTSRPGVTKKMVSAFESKKQVGTKPAVSGTGPKRSTSVTIPEWVDDKVEATKLKILVVYCHLEKKSFNGQLFNTTVDTLQKQGHDVTVSDLYEMKFNNTPNIADVVGEPSNAEFFSQVEEAAIAYEKGTLAQDILTEQQKVKDADLVLFQFPLHWGSFPAMLKGWVDRVLCKKFAFDDSNAFDTGLLQGKRALLSLTCSSTETAFSKKGIMGDINVYLWPIQNGILRVCGFDVLPPHIVYGVGPGKFDEKKAKTEVRAWQNRLRSIEMEPSLFYVPLEQFDDTMQLSGDGPKVQLPDGTECAGFGPTVGQHMGKTFPAEGQLKSGLQIILEKIQDKVANPEGGVTPEGIPQDLEKKSEEPPVEKKSETPVEKKSEEDTPKENGAAEEQKSQ